MASVDLRAWCCVRRRAFGLLTIVSAVMMLTLLAGAIVRPSLPVQNLVEILRKDPGLVLAVKQAIMDRAADEGRIVEPSDLTDDRLYRMLLTDPAVAAIASDKASQRGYFSAANVPEVPQQSQPGSVSRSVRPALPESDVSTAVGTAPSGVGSGTIADLAAHAPRVDADAALRDVVNSGQQMPGQASGAKALLQKPGEADTTNAGAAQWAGIQAVAPVRPIPAPNEHAEIGATAEKPLFTSRPHPYGRIPILSELYSQVSDSKPVLERFGASIFRNSTGNADDLPMDMPVGPDYVLGPGDGLKIELWGGVSERLQRVVDREGKVGLPEVGTVQIAGRSLGDAQDLVESALRSQFRDAHAEISLSRLRSVRIYVVGDVQRPGAYDISALSTPLNAMFAAGGPTIQGSLRTLRHYRGKQLVQEVDVYELILHGVRSGVQRLEPGDTILVPPVAGQVTLEGMVHRPAVYEMRTEKTLADALELGGGVLPSGAMRHIEVERVEAHQKRTMLSLDLPDTNDPEEISKALKGFAIQDGDRVSVSPILPYSYKSVYLDGHVFKPGKYPWHDGMTVADLLRSYSDVLPEPYIQYAEIVRLRQPDFHPKVIGFSLGDAMRRDAAVALEPFDTVRIFGRYDFEDAPQIKVSGEVRAPGTHQVNGETRLRDAIFLAGGPTPDALMDNVHVFRQLEGSKIRVLSANLGKALEGDATANIVLSPRDQVVVHRNPAKVDPAVVYISGQVAAAGKYPLGDGLTSSELVRLAGGFRRGAYTELADLSRFSIGTGQDGVRTETRQIHMDLAMAGEASEDVVLRDGDVLTIRQVSGWEDIGAAVTVRGEVAHPGTYGITPGEHLSSLLKRAGGFSAGAYPSGAILSRIQVKELAEKSKAELVERLQAAAMQMPQFAPGTSAEDQVALTNAMRQQQQQIISTLQKQESDGRLIIQISSDVRKWQNTPDDIELRDGDVLVVPKRPTFVLVSGQVYTPAAISHRPGKDAAWYVSKAGGTTELANSKAMFVIRADGSVVGQGSGGWFGGGISGLKLQPGDTVVVPEKLVSTNSVWRSLFGSAQIISALAITAKMISGL